jgi:chain length determinant protein tyrosine kinase EpsG
MKLHDNVLTIDVADREQEREPDDRRISAILVEEGKLTDEGAEKIAELQRREGLKFGEAALRLGLVSEDDLCWAVAKLYDYPHLLPGSESLSRELVTAYEPSGARAEEMRALRTQLLVRWFNPGARRPILAVVSPHPGEGRSYIAANLAITFSQLGERTLLIDADLRAPRQHRIFNVPDKVGLAAVLSGRGERGSAVPVPVLGGLSLLPAGALPPNPQELLSRTRFGALLKDMQAKFDVIIIDTPPAKVYADVQSVVYWAGSAIVLARKNHTRIDDTNGVAQGLADTGAHVVGTVVNNF